MTVRAYYERHAQDGRACLGRASVYEPPSWISKAVYRDAVSYWLCRRDELGIEQLDAERDVSTIETQPTRHNRWPATMPRKAQPFLLTA